MQPATHSVRTPEDLHSIMNRFQNWAVKQPEHLNGHRQVAAGVREIPMEEAMRQLRSRRAPSRSPEKPPQAQTPKESPAAGSKVTPPLKPASAGEAAIAVVRETAAAEPIPERKPTRKVRPATKTNVAAAAIETALAAKRGVTQKVAAPELAAPKAVREKPRKVRETEKKRLTALQAVKGARPNPRAARNDRKPEFREVLAHSVHAEKRERKQERRQRVSVRLTRAEERRLQQRANQAGMTVSEYLRQSALVTESPRPETERTEARIRIRNSKSAAAAPLSASSPTQGTPGLGGWIALLRNRFLASPARLAERA
jgi:hypothetical protein